MDNMKTIKDIESQSYTREEVLSIVSKYQGNVLDHLIHTYFNIFEIEKGSVYDTFQRRFNNIVLNNSKKITEQLIINIFYEKALNVLDVEFSSATYVSCIYPRNLTCGPCPVIIQYFNPFCGIEHRILAFISNHSELNSVLINHSLLNKLAGYCGDFLYNDPGVVNYKIDYFTSLNLLNSSTIRYLPYSDGFVSRLFDVLIDYLPENLTNSLTSLGETLMGTSTKTQFIQDLVRKYKHWLDNCRRPHLLLTDYVKEVIEHFSLINSYLEPFRCLPRSVEALMGSVLQRFLLVFMREVYLKVEEIKLLNNCAVTYYYQLIQIRDLFRLYKESNHIPPKALTYFYKETEGLIQNHVIDATNDDDKINELFTKIMKLTNTCFERAVQYMNPLINQFSDFHVFLWIFLKDSSLAVDDVLQTYHIIYNKSCSPCTELLNEVKYLNLMLSKFPLLEIEDNIVLKWVTLLKNCKPLPMITKLLEYLFALPASCNLLENCVISDSLYCQRKKIINFNWREKSHEHVINNLEEFLGEQYLDQARHIIKDNQIPTFVE